MYWKERGRNRLKSVLVTATAISNIAEGCGWRSWFGTVTARYLDKLKLVKVKL